MPKTRSGKQYKSVFDPPPPPIVTQAAIMAEIGKLIIQEIQKDNTFKVEELNLHLSIK
jgi:hypothetical protein